QSWVVGVERDHDAVVEIVLRGMLGDGLTHSSAEVAGDAELDGDLALGELFDQVCVLGGGEAVAYALGAQVERSPDRFWRARLAGVRGQSQALVGGVAIDAAEEFRRRLEFIAANAHADDMAVAVAR